MVYPWRNTRRYNSRADQCKNLYGSRLQRVSIHAGFTCPNRDGTIGTGGCTYCDNRSFSPAYCHTNLSITQQIDTGLEFLKKRYQRTSKFIAYFQAYSNTYSDIGHLKELYQEALTHPEIFGIAIGTRPDCIDEDKLDFLAHLSKKHFVSIEYGIESCYNKTLLSINRGHTYEDSVAAIELSAVRGLHTGAHIMFGLPGETRSMMLDQAQILSGLPINAIKFRQLQIVKGTRMAEEFSQHPENFDLFSMEEYLDFVVKFIERLRPEIAIERLAGEVPPVFRTGSQGWGGLRSDQVAALIEKRMADLDTWQGRLFSQHAAKI